MAYESSAHKIAEETAKKAKIKPEEEIAKKQTDYVLILNKEQETSITNNSILATLKTYLKSKQEVIGKPDEVSFNKSNYYPALDALQSLKTKDSKKTA